VALDDQLNKMLKPALFDCSSGVSPWDPWRGVQRWRQMALPHRCAASLRLAGNAIL